jgi:hypothetical protein
MLWQNNIAQIHDSVELFGHTTNFFLKRCATSVTRAANYYRIGGGWTKDSRFVKRARHPKLADCLTAICHGHKAILSRSASSVDKPSLYPHGHFAAGNQHG